MNLSWYTLTRQELLDVLAGEYKLQGPSLTSPYSSGDDVVLGMNNADRNGAPFIGVALVGTAKEELLSWISTYAEEAFPLTQFFRVCSVEDWTKLELGKRSEVTVGTVDPVWPSIVFGEMIGQADGNTDVAGVPLARATACFSFAFARAILLYPEHSVALDMCTDRLLSVEREPRFSGRNISVDSLRSVWSVAESLQNIPRDSFDVFDTVLEIVAAIDKKSADLLVSNKSLLSDSAEDRVVGFDITASTLSKELHSNTKRRTPSLVALAAAAMLAGRGTSHIQLLSPVAKLFPEVLVWYGLLAGVVGPRGWNKAWMQQVRGIERSLRQFFRSDEPVTADLCWPEYEWLSKTYSSPEVLSAIPKSAPRSLAIELLPGVNCQFRFRGQGADARTSEERRLAELMTKETVPAITESAIAQAVDMLAKVQNLLRSQGTHENSTQSSFFEGDSSTKKRRSTKRKAVRKPDKIPPR